MEKDLEEIEGILDGKDVKKIIPDADSQGKEESDKYTELEDASRKRTQILNASKENSEVYEHQSNEISQKTRQITLSCLQYPLIIGAVILATIAIISLVTLLVIEIKFVMAIIYKSPRELLNAIKGLPTSVVALGGLAAPTSALIIAIAAWLFKGSYKKN